MLLFQLFSLFLVVFLVQSVKPGVQLRLTKAGMNYAVDVGMEIMQKDLLKSKINQSGKNGYFTYKISNMAVSSAEFGMYKLTPVAGTGMKGRIGGISLTANGNVWFQSKGWIKISHDFNVSVKTKDISAEMIVDIGSDKDGHPTIAMTECKASVDDIDIHFKSVFFNLFSKILESVLKKSFGEMLCQIALKEIDAKANEELKTFPVTKRIDEWAKIDYSLTKTPLFTDSYMDAYLKGAFLSSSNQKKTLLFTPTFTANSDHSKMIYFWITDYTINSAGEVYHNAGALKTTISSWDKNTPKELKELLNVSKFQLLIPKLGAMYPNAPMSVSLKSYKAPNIVLTDGRLTIHLYAKGMFEVKDKNSKMNKVFTINFDVKASASISVRKDNVTAKISTFDYDAKIDQSFIGDISAPLNSPFIRAIVDVALIKKANPILRQGFPLPKVDDVCLENVDIHLYKDAIRVGSNIRYVKEE